MNGAAIQKWCGVFHGFSFSLEAQPQFSLIKLHQTWVVIHAYLATPSFAEVFALVGFSYVVGSILGVGCRVGHGRRWRAMSKNTLRRPTRLGKG